MDLKLQAKQRLQASKFGPEDKPDMDIATMRKRKQQGFPWHVAVTLAPTEHRATPWTVFMFCETEPDEKQARQLADSMGGPDSKIQSWKAVKA